jgi:hypothetical protein
MTRREIDRLFVAAIAVLAVGTLVWAIYGGGK